MYRCDGYNDKSFSTVFVILQLRCTSIPQRNGWDNSLVNYGISDTVVLELPPFTTEAAISSSVL